VQLYVDDRRVDDESVSTGTIEDILRLVQAKLCAPGRMVIGVRVDGDPVPGEAMPATLRQLAPSVDRLEVFTSTKERLVSDALAQASASLTETGTSAGFIADLLIEGKTCEATEDLGACLRVWQQVHEAVGKSIELLELDLDHTTIADEPLAVVIGRPKEVLVQIRDALVARDLVLLADILKYEFADVTETWQAVIARIRQAAEDLQEP